MHGEQLALPFEDEVLSFLYKAELEPSADAPRLYRVDSTLTGLLDQITARARSLGLRVVGTNSQFEYVGRTLHIRLRAWAERTA